MRSWKLVAAAPARQSLCSPRSLPRVHPTSLFGSKPRNPLPLSRLDVVNTLSLVPLSTPLAIPLSRCLRSSSSLTPGFIRRRSSGQSANDTCKVQSHQGLELTIQPHLLLKLWSWVQAIEEVAGPGPETRASANTAYHKLKTKMRRVLGPRN